MIALIVSGGTICSEDKFYEIAKKADIIIGCDKGCEALIKYNITPDYIVGDFDSITLDLNILTNLGAVKYQYPKEKDKTDSRIAFELAVEKGATEIIALGMTGTRYDHVLGNFDLLKTALDLNIKMQIIDDNNTIFLIKESTYLTGEKGANISFKAYFEKVDNLSILGAKYELKNYNLDVADSLAICNEFLNEDIYAQFDSGTLMVLYTKD